MAHMQSPVSALASLLSEHELDNTPRSPEAIWPLLCSWTGISIAIFSRFGMAPRPLAPTRAMRSYTCADVIQPCPVQHPTSFSPPEPSQSLRILRRVALGTRMAQPSSQSLLGKALWEKLPERPLF